MDTKKIGILDPDGININPLTNKAYSDDYIRYAKKWRKLPAYEKASEIINDINNHQVILVVSGTGSGKTVLVPKFVLHSFDYKEKIAITLPKQIISKSAAEYAAKTLDVELGKEVGYVYKGSDKSATGPNVKLLYATDGTIVSKLLKDPLLPEYQAVVIDEAHERKIQIDFLLFLLRNTLRSRKDFKLIIMSATIDDKLFESYFSGYSFKTIHIGGATHFPIENIYLDKPLMNNEYMKYGVGLIRNICNNTNGGDILFFVTSVNETQQVCDTIKDDNHFNYCVEVFAGMNPEKQELAQDKEKYKIILKKNRKIVVATNVAESSLTIDGIKYVIDSGYELLSYYDPELRAKVLERKLITQAQAIQRRGRTGRTEPGLCYNLYTKNDFESLMKKFPDPAIRTSNLYSECLRFLNLGNVQTVTNLNNVLSQFIEPPKDIFVDTAISQLIQLGLICDKVITSLGKLIADLQVDPMQGVVFCLGYKLQCARELLAIYSILDTTKGSIGELFIKSSLTDAIDNKKSEIKNQKIQQSKHNLAHKNSDHLTLLKIFSKYRELKQNHSEDQLMHWCHTHYIKKTILDKSYKTFQKTKDILRQHMSKYPSEKLFNIEFDKTLKLETKLLLCIAFGFRLNIINAKKYKINNNSFTNFKELEGSTIVYNELTNNNGKLEVNVVSKIPSNVQKIIEAI